jgi:hypothetical protein
MMAVIRKEIAGISFVAEFDGAIIERGPRAYHESFVKKTNESFSDVEVRIHHDLNGIPRVDGASRVFDSGTAWSMYEDHEEYFVVMKPEVFEKPLWIARVNRDFTKVTVHCGDERVSRKNGEAVVPNPVRYPLDQILLMHILAAREGGLFHAAGIDINGRGYIFPGKSGAGKSTITQQFAACEHIGLLSDDRVAVRKIQGAFRAFGTPWPGEGGIAENRSVPLSGIFFVCHGSGNRIEEITPQEAVERLLPVTSIPWYDRDIVPQMLSFCEDLISHVPAYDLHFKPGHEVVDVFEEFVLA